MFDALAKTESPATVASINDEPYDPSPQRNRAVIGAAVLRGAKQTYVLASAATAAASSSDGVPLRERRAGTMSGIRTSCRCVSSGRTPGG
ncbi:MAG: hypothetical protein ABIY55_01020 [Kofleriaceae bacterium]